MSGGERHPEDAVLVGADQLGGDLERQPGLAGPARPGDRDQARAVAQQVEHLVDLALAAEQRGGRHRQVGGVERLQRREVVVAELVEPRRRGEVLEPVLAEVAHARLSTRSRVVDESSTWPPWPAAAIRAPLCTSTPT